MANLRLHTPEGTSDSLPNEALNKRTICSRIMEVFTGYGYAEVVTPTFEYYDVFADEMGLLSQEAMLKFFDPEGRILTLRPDLTACAYDGDQARGGCAETLVCWKCISES